MLDRETRTAILRLQREGHGSRAIADAVGVSRGAVRRVLRSGQADVPPLERDSRLEPWLERVRVLYAECCGNVIRVAEKLGEEGVEVGYSTLTAFCRQHGIGQRPKRPSGAYHFEPGEEMQHDTSPHPVKVGGRMRRLQCASLVLCYSRVLFAQCYPRFSRFECRLFLTEALQYMGGAAWRAMIDNTSVILAHGSGPHAVVCAPMAALAERFGFVFVAHEPGDANRSARVERPFHYIEHNFYPGRDFADLDDLNAQLRDWCDRVARRTKPRLGASPLELYGIEQSRLRPLPLHVPEVYDVHSRRVDVDGYVTLHTNRYSVDAELIGRQLELRETRDEVRVYDGHRLVITYRRREPGARAKILLPAHRRQRGRSRRPQPPTSEERALRAADPAIATLCDKLRARYGGRAVRAMRQLHRIWLDYPTDAVVHAVSTALTYGLTDLGRIERMVLQRVAGDFFRLEAEPDNPLEEPDEG